MRMPLRAFGNMYGALLIDSRPPATREDDRLHARAAHFVDRHARNTFGDSGIERRLASRCLAEAGRQNAAHQDPINIAGVYTAGAYGAVNCRGPEVRGAGTAKSALKCTNRGAFGGHDDNGV
jgi:hypothetical protein